ncbi:MAG: DUF2459 domain-containing protein [Pseudomonadota bacterium]
MGRVFKWLRRSLYLAGGFLFLLIVSLLIGAIPFRLLVPPSSTEDKTVRVYVLSNGFHSDIVFPTDFALRNLPIDTDDYPVNSEAVQHYAIGWGSKTAFTSLLAVSGLTPSIMARALAFDDTVIHVTPLGALQPGKGAYAFDLPAEQAKALALDVATWFSDYQPLDGVTQGFGDRFYSSRGAFTPWFTCNSWTGQRLRRAGMEVGMWTPFAQTLEHGLAHASAQPQPL